MRRLLALVAVLLLGADPGSWTWPGPVVASVSVSDASASTPPLSGGTCYRVGCSVAVYWRVGVLPLTATAADAPSPAGWVERICLRSGYNGIAFITASGSQGVCVVAAYAPSP